MTAWSVLQSRGLLRVEFDLKGAFAFSIVGVLVNKVSGFGVCVGLWVSVCLGLV